MSTLKLTGGEGDLPEKNAPKDGRMLVVDDDPIVADSLTEFLREEGFDATTCYSAKEAIATLSRDSETPIEIVITDASMPSMDGMALLKAIRDEHPSIAVIMITGYGTIESAVEAVRGGAIDFIAKPIIESELMLSIERARREHVLLEENMSLRQRLSQREGFGEIVGADYRMAKAFELIEAVAPSRATVLLTGESGTGKSMVAKAIHKQSDRAEGPFVEIHCGSMPESLLESELFGHVKGAFTGAHDDKPGRFLAAHGGTIFIDEINSASPALQVKLLRVLQERKFEPVGSNETTEIDTRVLLATNEPLEDLVAKGEFREDLYYRINVITIDLPPLRERVSDIPLLAEHFIEKHAADHGKSVIGIEPEAINALQQYDFPGNVRELANFLERAVILAARPTITVNDLPDLNRVRSPGSRTSMLADGPWEPMPLSEALREPERAIILKALDANEWNRQVTAEQLGINRTTLYKKMKQLGIDRAAG